MPRIRLCSKPPDSPKKVTLKLNGLLELGDLSKEIHVLMMVYVAILFTIYQYENYIGTFHI